MDIDRAGRRLQQGAFAHNDRAIIVSGLPLEFFGGQPDAVFN
jgi:hypothetical protein